MKKRYASVLVIPFVLLTLSTTYEPKAWPNLTCLGPSSSFSNATPKAWPNLACLGRI
ncbi:MAG: hypothetical protein NT009_11570 [Proteobacteria bacterium]|nr:hypothetical protein [Pseudomonadota bacterium]